MAPISDSPSMSGDSEALPISERMEPARRSNSVRSISSQKSPIVPAANWTSDGQEEDQEYERVGHKSLRERVPEIIRPAGEAVRDSIDRVGKEWRQFIKDPPVVAIEGKRGKKVLGPGGAAGMGCGLGVGAGITGGWGLGIGSGNSLRFVMGVGVGCGVGVGYGYGFGFGSKWVAASDKSSGTWVRAGDS